MSTFDDTTLAIAGVYAESMLELATQQGEEESLRSELGDLSSLIAADEALSDFFASPLVDTEDRRKSLEATFRGRASDLLVDALQVLNRNGRVHLAPAVAQVYGELLDERQQRLEVHVTTAVDLSDALRQRVEDQVRKVTGREPRLTTAVEPDLLGGMVLRIGDRKVDGSLATQLKSFGGALLQRAEAEIFSGAYIENEG
ncbi:MAG: ATP synthase F1 subunit delta [Acidobacteriota bacterium]